MTVTGIIFSNLHDSSIPELTAMRTMASIPFGCRYRFIDFALSNMVNADITDVNIITHHNYRSLMDHVGAGKDWDLSRRTGGLTILPPYVLSTDKNAKMYYDTRLEALKSIADTVMRLTSDYVVLSDCDNICNINLNEAIETHIAYNADITACVKELDITPETSEQYNVIAYGDDGEVTDIINHPKNFAGRAAVSIDVWVVNTKYLQSIVKEAITSGYASLTKDLFCRKIGIDNLRIYKYDGFYAPIESIRDYFEVSMSMLDSENRNALFGIKSRPVFTKVRNSPPTIHSEGSKVVNSLIADGCTIEGTVENSILFRGVKIEKGAVVKNCILFQDTQISASAFVNCVIADKNVVVKSGVMLSGHPTMPFCIGKGKTI